jgi:dTDP-4-dehydrorhamnose reductase
MEVAIIGGNGFLGSVLFEKLSESYSVTNLTRNNIHDYKSTPFDLVINSNGNSNKFWANMNPLEDFDLSTKSVYWSLLNLKYKSYLYISSVDAGVKNYYGLNKRLSEEIVKSFLDAYVILRCSVILGKGMKKGVVKDILDGSEVFVTPDSQLQFITAEEIANIVKRIIDTGVSGTTLNVCGKDPVSVADIATMLKKPIKYSTVLNTQKFNDDVDNLLIIYPELKSSKEYILEVLDERVE